MTPTSKIIRLLTQSQIWVWSVIVLSILVCGAIAWLYAQQQQTLWQTTTALQNLRQARLDLAKGFLYVSLGDDPAVPFNRDQGLALLQQAQLSFEQAQQWNDVDGLNPVEGQTLAAFRSSLEHFYEQLATWRTAPAAQPALDTSLRIAFFGLERQADQLDLQIQQNLLALDERLAAQFRITLAVAALLLAGVCGVVWIVGRAEARAEATLRESEAKYRTLVETMEEGLAIGDSGTRLTYVNPAFARMLDQSPEALVGRHFTEFLDDDSQRRYLAEQQKRAAGMSSVYEVSMLGAGGQRVECHIAGQPLRDAHGNFVGSFGVLTDITARKHAEEALRESETRFRTLVEQAPIAIFVQTQKQFAYVNHAALRLFGAAADSQLMRQPVLDQFHPACRPQVQARIQQLNEQRRGVAVAEETILKLDGTSVPVEVSAVPFNFQGELGALVFASDITERKEAETLIRHQTDQLQAQNEALLAQNEELVAQERALTLAEAELQRQNTYLTALQVTMLDLIVQRDLDPLLHTLVRRAAQLFNTSAGYLDLVEPETGRLLPRIGVGALAESLHYEVAQGEGVAGVVWQTGQPLVVDDYDTWPGRIAAFGRQTIHSIVGVPLLEQNQAIGVLGLAYEHADHRVFPAETVDILTQFARLAVIAIGNARLFTQAQHELAERQQIEVALRENEARLKRAQQIAHLGHWTWDTRANHVAWSDEMYRIFGVAPQAFDGRLDEIMRRTIHPEDVERVFALNTAVTQAARPQEAEYRVIWPDGSIHQLWAQPGDQVTDAQGNILQLSGIVQDITDRKQAEMLIQQQADLLQAQNEELQAQNEELVVQGHTLVQAETELRGLNTELEQRVASRTTELRQVNEDLARVMRGKDEFLAGMSHELRTPLTGILGLTESLEMQIYGPLSEKQHHAVHLVRESGQHLLILINDVLDLARVEAGKLELDLGPVSVKEVCQASLRLTYGQANSKQITSTLQLDPFITVLWADERRLKQVLVNLLSNAVKFTPAQGRIGLEVAGDVAREEIHFTVWDTGVGISAENLARLFQPFVQVDNALTRASSGSGLGLALVRRMAELHGGRVAAESEGVPGHGSRFTVTLPWKSTTSSPNAASDERQGETTMPAPVAQGQLVLVADDVETIREVLTAYLTTLGCQVALARDGVEAWAMLQDLKPALALLDIQMPGLDGLEVTRRLRAHPALTHMPVIAMTALTMPGDRERCLAAGANDYLSKPINLAQLTDQVKHWLAGR